MTSDDLAAMRIAAAGARVLVVGDVMLDRYWFGDVHRISPEAPVPVVKVEKSDERLGGAANVARNAVALGAQTTLLSVVGDDEPGQTIRRLLESAGIRTSLHVDTAFKTTIKLRVIGRQQQLLRIDFEETPSHEVLTGKLSEFKRLLDEADVVILSDYGKGGLTHIAAMIDAAFAAGKKVLVDPKGEDYSRYTGATVLTPNRSELRQVVGGWNSEAELITKAQKLRRELGLEALLLTRSEDGMTLFTESGEVNMKAQAREVFDVSGAGDTVIATLAALLGGGASLADAAALANKAGGIVVGKLGTAVVTPQELF
jgi:D-glycero-beta-D-manno-heptose-7-phosphate kinase